MIFGALLLLACLLRLYLILSTTYIWDEDREWIPLARSISVSGDTVNLPWRSILHPAMTAYLAKATSAVLGESPLGFRIGFAMAGVVTIWAVGMLAWAWLGFAGAVIAVTLMTFNEYHLAVSAFAVEKSPYLMCGALAVLHFGRFLAHERTRNLYFAALFAGLGFLFKETAGLLLPAFVGALLVSGKAGWLRRKESYFAAGLGALVVLPDIVWNIAHWDRGFGQHASRLSGLGLNRHFFLFFGRDVIRDLYQSAGVRLFDPVPEYPSMNILWGALLLTAAVVAVLRWRSLAPIGRLAAILFWVVLLFFVSNKPVASRFVAETQTMIDSKAWFWVDQVLIGGALLAAWCYACLTQRRYRIAFGIIFVAACAVSTTRLIRDKLGIPTARVVVAPNSVSPADGRLVDVRAFMFACQWCNPHFRLVETATDHFDGRGPVASSPGEIVGADVGTDARTFNVRATTGSSADRLTYVFTYSVADDGSLPRRISARVTVADRNRGGLLPFWAQ